MGKSSIWDDKVCGDILQLFKALALRQNGQCVEFSPTRCLRHYSSLPLRLHAASPQKNPISSRVNCLPKIAARVHLKIIIGRSPDCSSNQNNLVQTCPSHLTVTVPEYHDSNFPTAKNPWRWFKIPSLTQPPHEQVEMWTLQ